MIAGVSSLARSAMGSRRRLARREPQNLRRQTRQRKGNLSTHSTILVVHRRGRLLHDQQQQRQSEQEYSTSVLEQGRQQQRVRDCPSSIPSPFSASCAFRTYTLFANRNHAEASTVGRLHHAGGYTCSGIGIFPLRRAGHVILSLPHNVHHRRNLASR